MWDEIIEGDCNGFNYYDADSEFAVDGLDDDSCICPSEHNKPKKKSATTWKCKDGTTMLLSEMTDKHLENSINYCNRRREYATVILLTNEKNRRLYEKQKEECKKQERKCQFCKQIMKVKKFDFESDPEDCTGGWGYSDYRLVCKCGAMGPVIKSEGLKP